MDTSKENKYSKLPDSVHIGFTSVRGSREIIPLGNSEELQMQGKHCFTMEAWIMILAFNRDQQKDNAIVAIDDFGTGAFHVVVRDRKIFCSFYGPPQLICEKQLETNTFYHIAIVFDPTIDEGPFTLYVNGSEEKIEQDPRKVIQPKKCHLNLARYASGRELNGFLCELRIWDCVRSQEQIKANLFKKISDNPENLQVFWPNIVSKMKSTRNILICEKWHPDLFKYSPVSVKTSILCFLMVLQKQSRDNNLCIPKLSQDVLRHIFSFAYGPIVELCPN